MNITEKVEQYKTELIKQEEEVEIEEYLRLHLDGTQEESELYDVMTKKILVPENESTLLAFIRDNYQSLPEKVQALEKLLLNTSWAKRWEVYYGLRTDILGERDRIGSKYHRYKVMKEKKKRKIEERTDKWYDLFNKLPDDLKLDMKKELHAEENKKRKYEKIFYPPISSIPINF